MKNLKELYSNYSKVEWKWISVSKARYYIIVIKVTIYLFCFSIVVVIIWAIIMSIVWFFMWWEENSQIEADKSLSYSHNVGDIKVSFNSNNVDIPFGIPIEEWRITYWYDYTRYSSNIITNFLKITLPWTTEFYKWHAWLDFWQTWTNKRDQYLPKIFSTNRGIVKQVENITWGSILENDYYKELYTSNGVQQINSSVAKLSSKKKKPYWNHVIISTYDWRFYIMYAHMSETAELKWADSIDIWQILWIMGTTWNSTWNHLHYEIRRCWENNTSFNKEFNWCYPINPLWFLEWSETTFLWFNELPPNNSFTYGNEISKNKTVAEDEINTNIIKDFEKSCFIKTSSCMEVFPFIYQNKWSEDYPEVPEFLRSYAISKYLWEVYNINADKIDESYLNIIWNEEWMIFKSKESLMTYLNSNLSFGPFFNTNRIYSKKKKYNFSEDLKEDLEKINENDIERKYKIFYKDLVQYSNNENPYIYNFYENPSLLQIKDLSWSFIKYYNNFGLVKIYKIISNS